MGFFLWILFEMSPNLFDKNPTKKQQNSVMTPQSITP